MSPSRFGFKKVVLLVSLCAGIAAFFFLGGAKHLTFEALKSNQADLMVYTHENWVVSLLAFFVVYVGVTALSLPGAAILTLAAGALFGLFMGSVLVSFASSIGATLAFLSARFLLKDWVQARFGEKLKGINAGIEKEGAFYLFTLRLVPLFPFFVVNLVMGLTPIRIGPFFWVSQIGMLPGTVIYVYAGTQLAQIESAKDILSPQLLIAFALVGIFPVVAKKVSNRLRKKREGAR